jgi:ATP-dependent DNA helicase DinG
METSNAITQAEMDLVKDVYRVLSESPYFRKRNQQRRLIGFASNIFGNGEIGIAEAPTGVGKTVSYLVSGIAASIVRKKRLIVSTATVALQKQIISKDIEVVSSAFRQLGYSINTSLIKGRERYVCNIKLLSKDAQNDMFNDNKDAELIGNLQNDLQKFQWDGEAESYKKVIPLKLWQEIKSDRHSCNGDKCHEFKSCPYFLKINEAKSAEVVIVNHSLMLSGLMHVPNSMYGEFDKNIYVFDEGHHIPDKSNSIFASHIPSDMSWLARDVKSIMTSASAPVALRTNATLQSTILTERLKTASKLMSQYGRGKTMVRFKFGVVPDDILNALGEAFHALQTLLTTHFDYVDKNNHFSNKEKMEFTTLKGKLDELLVGIENYVAHDEEKPIAKWAELQDGEWQFRCSPFDAGSILYHKIWKNALEKKSGVLITSATIASTNGFDRFIADIGLNAEQVKTILLDTPYQEAYDKVQMTVPKMRFMPENVVGHTDEVRHHIEKSFSDTEGGILVLFASNKQMKDVHKLLPANIQDSILMQGQYGFSEIIDKHKQRIGSNLQSMIFGLSTFAEGVDLPGNLCTKVIITKIPFPSPDEPLIAAACEWVNKKTNNLAFSIVMMPKAGIRFKQSVGRLIRSDTDYGNILVLDRRLLEKSYGKSLMNNMPLRARYA